MRVSQPALRFDAAPVPSTNETEENTMFNPKSDYTLNKMDPKAIVYIDSEGALVRLTLEDFASPEEFQRWKEWSDSDYHKIDNADVTFYKHALSLHGLSEQVMAVQSPEELLIMLQE